MDVRKLLTISLVLLLLFLIFYPTSSPRNDNIIYIKDFLTHEDFQKINTLNNEKDSFIYENFRYAKPLQEQFVYDIFYDNHYLNKIRGYLNNDILKSDFPIEHRFYHKESPGMKWHKDTLLYEEPQYEAIYTIDNQSSSMTQWKDEKGKIDEIWTEPNSLLVVKAQGYEHHVTPPLSGEREILKLIYTQTNNVNANYHKEMKRFNKFKND